MSKWEETVKAYRRAGSAWQHGIDFALQHIGHLYEEDQWVIMEVLVGELFLHVQKKTSNHPDVPELIAGPGAAIFGVLITAEYLNVSTLDALRLIQAHHVVRASTKYEEAWRAMSRIALGEMVWKNIEGFQVSHLILSQDLQPPPLQILSVVSLILYLRYFNLTQFASQNSCLLLPQILE